MNLVPVQIGRILQTMTPEAPAGKSYTIHSWACEGFINGQPTQSFVVKTFSGKIAGQINAMQFTEFNAEVDEFNGAISYKVPKSYYANPQYQNNAPAQAPAPAQAAPPPQQQAPAQAPAQAPLQYPAPAQSSVTIEEMKALYTDLFQWASTLGEEASIAMSATGCLFIECMRKGIKLEKPAPNWGGEQAGQDIGLQINHALNNAQLLERVQKAKVPQDILEQWYSSSDGDNAFAKLVNDKLVEQGA